MIYCQLSEERLWIGKKKKNVWKCLVTPLIFYFLKLHCTLVERHKRNIWLFFFSPHFTPGFDMCV